MAILAVMIGGALGSLTRYATALWLQGGLAGSSFASFPLATLTVNVAGCFLLALISTLGLQGAVSPSWRLALETGFLGAMTTFSTFELESDRLIRDGLWLRFSLYALGNLLLGYLAIVAGRELAVRLGGN
jgi:CrcB protein